MRLHIPDGVVISILRCFGELERSMGGGGCHNTIGLRLKSQGVDFQITRGFIFRNRRRDASVPINHCFEEFQTLVLWGTELEFCEMAVVTAVLWSILLCRGICGSDRTE